MGEVIDFRWKIIERTNKRLKKDRSEHGQLVYLGWLLRMCNLYPEKQKYLLGKD